MKTLERGFKSWSERTASKLRRELKRPDFAPIDVRALAKHMEVRLWTPQDVPDLPKEAANQLLSVDPDGWSAVTVETESETTVIYNPAHSPKRQASDIAHELAHVLLEHRGSTLVMSVNSSIVMRSFDDKQEDEANWLGWAVLLPRVALVRERRARRSISEISDEYGVSEPLVKFRLQTTGVDRQLARTRKTGTPSP